MHASSCTPSNRKRRDVLKRFVKHVWKRPWMLTLVVLCCSLLFFPEYALHSRPLTEILGTSSVFIVSQDPCDVARLSNPMKHRIRYLALEPRLSDCEGLQAASPYVTELICEPFLNCGQKIKTETEVLGTASSSVILCVGCDTSLQASLSSLDIPFISMPSREFKEAVWFTSLTINELESWHDLKYEIAVVTTCRMRTLTSLLQNLGDAFYFGDTLRLSIFLESSPSVECLDLVDRFEWKHGSKSIHQRIRPSGGPEVAIPEAVRPPATQRDFSILLEDDIGVSTQFYSWLKFVGLQMVNTKAYVQSHIFSISLYTPRVLETGVLRREPIDYEEKNLQRGSIFAFEVPCSWGSAFQGAFWRNALGYFEQRYADHQGNKEVIKNSRVSGWKGSWKKWLIELSYIQHAVTIYPLFDNETSFSTNMLMKGMHIETASKEMRQQYEVPLFQSSSWYFQLQSPRVFQSHIDSFDAFFERTPNSKLHTPHFG